MVSVTRIFNDRADTTNGTYYEFSPLSGVGTPPPDAVIIFALGYTRGGGSTPELPTTVTFGGVAATRIASASDHYYTPGSGQSFSLQVYMVTGGTYTNARVIATFANNHSGMGVVGFRLDGVVNTGTGAGDAILHLQQAISAEPTVTLSTVVGNPNVVVAFNAHTDNSSSSWTASGHTPLETARSAYTTPNSAVEGAVFEGTVTDVRLQVTGGSMRAMLSTISLAAQALVGYGSLISLPGKPGRNRLVRPL